LAIDFLAEIVHLLRGESTEHERARIDPGRRVSLDEDQVATVLCGWRVPEVVESDVVERGRRCVARDVPANIGVLVRTNDHGHRELLAMVCGVAMAAACGCFWTDCMRRSRRLHPPARAACRPTARSCYHAAEEASRRAVAGLGHDAPVRIASCVARLSPPAALPSRQPRQQARYARGGDSNVRRSVTMASTVVSCGAAGTRSTSCSSNAPATRAAPFSSNGSRRS